MPSQTIMARKMLFLFMSCHCLITLVHSVPVKGSEFPANSQPIVTLSRLLVPSETKPNISDVARSFMKLKSVGLFNRWDCEVCKFGVSVIQDLAAGNKTDDEIANRVSELCIKFKIEQPEVCRGIVNLFRDEVLTVFSHIVLDPNEACGFIFGQNCSSVYKPWKPWNISIPNTHKPPPAKPDLPQPGDKTLRVLHLTDIHLDQQYLPGSNAQCHEPICCRNSSQPIVGPPAGFWGDHRECDLPEWTLDNLFQHLNQSDKFDYIMWTGDLPAHYVWLQSKEDVKKLMKLFTDKLQYSFPGVPVYATLGNHEGVPVNSFPPPSFGVVPPPDQSTWLYEASVTSWLHWLPDNTRSTITRGGFYAVQVRPGLKLISLNTNFCNGGNWWLLLNTTDPQGQLEWLVGELQKSELIKEKVHIISHIPPGSSGCLNAWSWNYYRIINRYEDTVVSQFFGHTHGDEFQLFYDPDSNWTRPVGVSYIAPSVDPSNNPAYRVYTIDGRANNSTWRVLDHETYIMNLTDANLTNRTEWQLEYTALKAYNMASLLPVEWHKLLMRMIHDNSYLQKYYKYHIRNFPSGTVCDKKCKASLLCSIQSSYNGAKPPLCNVPHV